MQSTSYRHEQTSYWAAAFMLLLFIPVFALVLRAEDDALAGQLIAAAVLSLVVLLRLALATMVTEITANHVRARYRPLGPTRTILLEAVVSHERVQLPWYFGFGGVQRIHGRSGWGFSTWGLDAVEIRYRDDRRGERKFFIGTDDADGLDAALSVASTRRR